MLNAITGERALAYPVVIEEVKPILGLDKDGNSYNSIEYVRVNNWWVVNKAPNKIGDLVIYCEIDSLLPECELYEFLRKKKFRVKSIRMCRTYLSQGLIIPLSSLPDSFDKSTLTMETDLTEVLSIKKYEPKESYDRVKFLPGNAKGLIPEFIRRTDQERIQNMGRTVEENSFDYEKSEKLDGSSISIFAKKDLILDENQVPVEDWRTGVCSRKMELKDVSGDNPNYTSEFWTTVHKQDLDNKILTFCKESNRSLAFQGELVGPGIQSNKYKLNEYEICIFDIWDIDNRQYLLPSERRFICDELHILQVPIVEKSATNRKTVSELLEDSNGKTVFGNNPNQNREGFVYKHNTIRGLSFKVISNDFLLESKE